jgi:hypothetical protein
VGVALLLAGRCRRGCSYVGDAPAQVGEDGGVDASYPAVVRTGGVFFAPLLVLL